MTKFTVLPIEVILDYFLIEVRIDDEDRDACVEESHDEHAVLSH
jgi:hypothetical protein